jgi:transposase
MSQLTQSVSYACTSLNGPVWTLEQFASFVGVDLHKHTVTLVAVDPRQNVIGHLTTSTKCVDQIEKFLRSLPRPVWMAVEADGFIEWFLDRYGPVVDLISIANATELALRRGKRRKNDFNDAKDIGERLARGECPLGWIADPETARLRKLGRHWHQLSRTLSRAKHCMRSILNAANLPGPSKLEGDLTQRWLLGFGHLLKEESRKAFENFLDVILLLERHREALRLKITFANRAEKFKALTTLVKTVPGIDEIWACVIAAEIGTFDRFPNADTLEFWAGLTPDNELSAGKSRDGKITKAGSRTLRWALGKAAMVLCRSDRTQEKIRRRLIRTTGKKAKANVAMARRLLHILFAMHRDQKPYIVGEPTNHQAKANRARLKKQRKSPKADQAA